MKFKQIFSSLFTAIAILAVVSFSSCNSTNNTDHEEDTNTEEANTEDVTTEDNNSEDNNHVVAEGAGKVIQMNSADFKELVFNYDAGEDWKYLGDLPCVIDFYADWCNPCKMVAPIMDELAEEYAGKVVFYKVDVDKQLSTYEYNIKGEPVKMQVERVVKVYINGREEK